MDVVRAPACWFHMRLAKLVSSSNKRPSMPHAPDGPRCVCVCVHIEVSGYLRYY